MENNKNIQTLKDLLDMSNQSIEDFLKTPLCVSLECNELEQAGILKHYDQLIKTMADSISRVIKHQNILGAMCNFLLSRYHEIASLHSCDLDPTNLELDRDEMYKEFEKNK